MMEQKDLLFSSFVNLDSLFKSAVELSVFAGTLFSSLLAETTGSSGRFWKTAFLWPVCPSPHSFHMDTDMFYVFCS